MKKQILATMVALAFSGTVAAQQIPFWQLDKDRDGRLSRAEAQVVQGLDFDLADLDGDGMLSMEEYDFFYNTD